MGIIAQNKISSLGMLFGAIALMMGIIHFSFGPFSAPPPTLESIVADKTAEIKRGLLAGIKGEKITTVERKEDVDVDKILDQSGIALAIAALLCAFIGGMRKENRWGIRGARVVIFVHAVTEAHQAERIIFIFRTTNKFRNVFNGANFFQHFQRRF
ncbi:inner membrane protein yidI, partial [Escherichia coli 97.1742]